MTNSLHTLSILQHVTGEPSESCLEELPWSVRDSVALYERMDASFNCLTELPPELPMRLPHLNHLNMAHNNLVVLPGKSPSVPSSLVLTHTGLYKIFPLSMKYYQWI